jgi:hypothetical protein
MRGHAWHTANYEHVESAIPEADYYSRVIARQD